MATEAVAVRMDPESLLKAAVDKGASVETLERLVSLAKDVRQEQARSAWYEAMAEFQKRCPEITKTKKADIKGLYTYKYAPLDEIMAAIRPLLGELGLSVFWSSPPQAPAGHVVTCCRVAHVLGHVEESGQVSLPIPDASERGGGNPLQRIGSALSYARRYSLMSIMGISPEDDDDARSAGDGKGSGKDAGPGAQSAQQDTRVVFPFGKFKDKRPDELTVDQLYHELDFWQEKVNDPKSTKFRDSNQRILDAVQSAIAEKHSASLQNPPQTAQEASPSPPTEPTLPGTLSEKDAAWVTVRELMAAKDWTDSKLVVWARKTKGVGPEELDLEAVKTLIMHLRSS